MARIDVVSKKIIDKQKRTENFFKMLYPTKEEQDKREDILEEILYQIEVCEEMLIHISYATIIKWLQFDSVREVERKARSLKFA